VSESFFVERSDTTYWVLLVSNNPGGPNGGSGTQYFIGDWDGHRFTPADTLTRWIDYGPDDYAGITYNNLGNQRVFLGWMSNWDYANMVPTQTWRNAMTIPRELSLRRSGGRLYLASRPWGLLSRLAAEKTSNHQTDDRVGLYRLDVSDIPLQSFTEIFSNGKQEVVFGYDQEANRYYIDRSRSGEKDFHPGFGARYYAPRISTGETISLTIVIDASSIEVFADDGLTVMTAVFFAESTLGRINTNAGGTAHVTDLISALP